MTSRDEHRNLETWQPRVAIGMLPFIRLSEHDAIPQGHVALVDTTQMDGAMESATAALHPMELAMVAALPETRRALFISGRLALRAAINRVDNSATSLALLRNPRGAPMVPPGLIGSISHKRTTAVAMVAPAVGERGHLATIGIDVEERAHMRPGLRDISSRILTSAEQRFLPERASDRTEAVLLFFAMKEAIYKAIDPYVERHVRFQEVEVTAHGSLMNDTGSGLVALNLPEFEQHAPVVSVHWWKDESHLFAVATSSRVR